ncbi:MAG: DUF1841 family protein [Burkholderiaceae bacterium]
MFDPSQEDVRRFFCTLWKKHGDHQPLTPLEAIALDWVLQHPEYHDELADVEQALQADYSGDGGRTNPFLHLSMHLAIAEQLSIDQPRGIRQASDRLVRRLDDPHQAAHEIMECLGQMLWKSQRDGQPPDGEAYVDCVRRRAA